ncbi:hypothetical protein [Pseudomonas sp. HY7a-MNA-CIBAN-0227]|uniref:hypothetical protein n=1 Tax=Pseudomonas sp. HY7a-MNA-CIBAN-0227 TaxID=3140474 RepID=UPI003330945A
MENDNKEAIKTQAGNPQEIIENSPYEFSDEVIDHIYKKYKTGMAKNKQQIEQRDSKSNSENTN